MKVESGKWKVAGERGQRLLAGSTERSNFDEVKVRASADKAKCQGIQQSPCAGSFTTFRMTQYNGSRFYFGTAFSSFFYSPTEQSSLSFCYLIKI
jgi:hypothetical protein